METKIPDEGFLLTSGRMVAIDDVEAMYADLSARERDPEKLERMLFGLTRECLDYRRWDGAIAYLEKILTLARGDETRAFCFLEIGRALEKKPDFAAAADAYARALTLPAKRTEHRYFISNNLGFCLNQLGRNDEAEAHCRAAIAIQPLLHNAHKNLGVCLEAKGQLVEAARCFFAAARIAPTDSRALGHLEDLLARHAEVGREHPEILEAAQACRVGAERRNGARPM